MRKVWIVVANSTLCIIYHAENVNVLSMHHRLEHEEGHLKGQELVSDGMGRVTQRAGFGSDTYEDPTPIKLKEANQFADRISQVLKEGFHAGAFERLYLISKPPFLASLRNALPEKLSKVVYNEVHKDLTQMTPKEIREYLPPVL